MTGAASRGSLSVVPMTCAPCISFEQGSGKLCNNVLLEFPWATTSFSSTRSKIRTRSSGADGRPWKPVGPTKSCRVGWGFGWTSTRHR